MTRTALAAQIRQVRRMDQAREYVDFRSHHNYREHLRGLNYILDYVRIVPGSNKIVDVGAGSTNATLRLAESSYYGKNLDFYATGLTQSAKWSYFKSEKFKVTPVELMRGFDAGSIAGILAVNSVAYSSNPNRAVEIIDEILVPGGAVKATFSEKDRDDDALFKTHHLFTAAFQERGFDVAVLDHPGQFDVLLAIKPDSVTGATADHLLQLDVNTERLQFWEEGEAHIKEVHGYE